MDKISTWIVMIIVFAICGGLIFVVGKIGDPLAIKIEEMIFGDHYRPRGRHRTYKHNSIVLAFLLMLLVGIKASSGILAILTFAVVSIGGWALIKIIEDATGMAVDKAGDSIGQKLSRKKNAEESRPSAPMNLADRHKTPPPQVKAFCPNCGNKLEEGSLFCGKCGTRIG